MENATTNFCVFVGWWEIVKKSKVDKRLTHSQFVAAMKDYDN